MANGKKETQEEKNRRIEAELRARGKTFTSSAEIKRQNAEREARVKEKEQRGPRDIPNQVGANIPNQVGANIPNQIFYEGGYGGAADARRKRIIEEQSK